MGDEFRLVVRNRGELIFDDVDDARMQSHTLRAKEAFVGCILDEYMFESVHRLGWRAVLIDQLGLNQSIEREA